MEITLPLASDTAAREMLQASRASDFHAGSAEPWVADVLAALLIANGTRHAIEIGGFEGRTSEALARALTRQPWPTTLIVCDIDPERAATIRDRLVALDIPSSVECRVAVADSHAWLPTLTPDSIDFAWLDGNHEQAHVAREIELLWPALAPGGLMTFHDVYGVCRLSEVVAHFGGYSLDIPRLGPAGGIGLLQKPRLPR